MKVYQLKREYYLRHPDGHYFDRDTLRFFGERISDMKVTRLYEKVVDSMGVAHDVWQLSKLSRNAPGGPKRTYAYFDVNTYDVIVPNWE